MEYRNSASNKKNILGATTIFVAVTIAHPRAEPAHFDSRLTHLSSFSLSTCAQHPLLLSGAVVSQTVSNESVNPQRFRMNIQAWCMNSTGV